MASPGSRGSRSPSRRVPSARAWIKATLGRLSLREKIGQLLMPDLFGAFTPAGSPGHERLRRLVRDCGIGGLMIAARRGPLGIERGKLYPTVMLLNELQSLASVPLLISADMENGAGMRLEEATSFPSAMTLAAADDPALGRIAGRDTALEARAAGIHWIFAPVADVNTNPANPIVNTRAFGEDPARAAEFVAHTIRGIQKNGCLATAKHFPGHGDASVDSHLLLPAINRTREELDRGELLTFRAAIAAGVRAIMPGHLAVPALDPGGAPASISHAILTELLRNSMRFRGLIVTDAMDMGGITRFCPPGEAAVRAIAAGADVILLPPLPEAALDAIEKAVQAGRISEARIEISARRILEAKAAAGLHRSASLDLSALPRTIARPDFQLDAQRIADRGLTLLRNSDGILPLDARKPHRVLLAALSADPDPAPARVLEAEIGSRADSVIARRADAQFSPAAALNLPRPDQYDIAVVAIFVRVADRKGSIGLPEEQHAVVKRILGAGKPAVVAAFGSPYLIERFPDAATWIASFSTGATAQRAAARAAFGEISVGGKIPVTVPGAARRGEGLRVSSIPMALDPAPASLTSLLHPAFNMLANAVCDQAFPGGVLAVGLKNQLAIHAFGKLSHAPKAAAVKPDTIYDVASLTKPVLTTTAAMILFERGQLDLDAPLTRYLPEFAEAASSGAELRDRAAVTVRMLLLHSSGLPAHREFFRDARGYHAILSRVLAEPLANPPGSRIEYSDLGFILLGEILQRVSGKRLDVFARDEIFAPLAMRNTCFNPGRALLGRIAPAENDTSFRKRLIRGEAHDENAWAMGGVAGHAGLFSTAGDLAIFAQTILNGGIYAHRRIVRRDAIRLFATRQPIESSARALGWDVPTPPSSSGRYFSPASIGHTGFTGTSLWIDPARDLFVILLTNRVHPTRANDEIRRVRPALHDAVAEALNLARKGSISTEASIVRTG